MITRFRFVCLLAAIAGAGFFLGTLAQAQVFQVLYSDSSGANPHAGLTQGSDGNFYGTTYNGGANGYGAIFKMTPEGVLTTLASFNSTNGANPEAGLVQGKDGNFYGTTDQRGPFNNEYGTAFKVTPDGTLTSLLNFTYLTGGMPTGGLVQGDDGSFYGATDGGGLSGYGAIFKINSGGALTTLGALSNSAGSGPSSLLRGSDGNFYGTAYQGGANNAGTVFKVTPDGTLTTLVSFHGTDGRNPAAGLVQGSDGNFYGTTYSGGASGTGTVFKVTPDGTLTTVVSFNLPIGSYPQAGLVQGSDGCLYGTSADGTGLTHTVFKVTPDGTLTTLVTFDPTNGSSPRGTPYDSPYAGLMQGTDGNFYGTTYKGGVSNSGTIFKMTPAGAITMQVSFNRSNGADPYGALVQGSDGSFYGTTYDGGVNGYGAVFKVTPGGALKTMVNFDLTNGANPYAGLTQGRDGNFYGTTYNGGAYGVGTVFQVTPDGTLTTLVSFNSPDGYCPYGGLVQGSDGGFYGTTVDGGMNGCGTVFKVTVGGILTTLVSFNGTNGNYPQAGLTIGKDGNFYGTASKGGANGFGTVFKMTPGGTLTTLASFGSAEDGSPSGTLVQGADGNFYGMTYDTVFKVTPGGVLTTLTRFRWVDGENTYGGLTQGPDGNFYGTMNQGGASGLGSVFRVTPAGALTVLYSFDGSSGGSPQCTPVFGSDGNLYGTAGQMAIWRIVPAPAVVTGGASGITLTSANLSGTVAPDGSDTNVLFEYGTSTAYGSLAAATPETVSGTSGPTTVSAALSGLSPHTLYHYRLDASNSFGPNLGADATFTTNTQPTAGSSTVSINTGNTATITLPFATTDADGDSVTVQSISAGSGAPFTLGTVTGNTVPVTASLNAAGTGTINFTVTDGFGGTADGSVTVTVTDNLPPVFANVPSDLTVEAPGGASGAVVNYPAVTASDNVGVTSLTSNYPSGSTFPIGQTVVQYTAADAAGNTTQASFKITVRSGDAAANALGVKGAAVAGSGVSTGTIWSGFGVACVAASGDTFFRATLKAGKVTQTGIVLVDGTTGNVTPLVQAGAPVPGRAGVTFSVFKDPAAVSTPGGGEAMVYLATIAGASVTKANNQLLVRGWLSGSATTETDGLGRSGMVIGKEGAEVLKFTSLGLSVDGTVWALASLVPGVGGATKTNNIALLSWAPGATEPAEVLRRGGSLTLSDGSSHVVNTIATLASASGSPGQERWEGPEGLIARVGFTDGASAVLTTTIEGTVTEVARKGGLVTLRDSTGAVESVGAQWASFGLPALDLGGGTTFKATLAAKFGGVTSKNATGIFRQEAGSSQWTALVRIGNGTGLSDNSVFSSFNDPISNGAGTVAFIAARLAGTVRTTGLWTSSIAHSGSSSSRVLTQIAAMGQTAPETGGGVFASFVSVALPEWENAGPLFVATLQTGPQGTAGPGGVTSATKTGLWGVDYNGNVRLLLRTGSPLPGAAAGSPVVKTFAVLKAVSGSAGQARAVDALREVACNVTFSNGSTAVVKIQVP